MTEFEQLTLESAINHFGVKPQLVKLMEECGELVQAAGKSIYAEDFNASLDHLAEEMADVEILIDQFRLEFPRLIDSSMADWREKKIDRLQYVIDCLENALDTVCGLK